MYNLLCCCFNSQPKPPPPLPKWTDGFSPSVINALGGGRKVSALPVYERLFVLPANLDHLTDNDHAKMNEHLKSQKKNIGVFHIYQKNQNGKTEDKADIIFIRVFDRQASNTELAMYGIYIEGQEISYAFINQSSQHLFSEQTSSLRLEPVEALMNGNSLGIYDTESNERMSEDSPIIAGHEGRIILANPEE